MWRLPVVYTMAHMQGHELLSIFLVHLKGMDPEETTSIET